MGEAKPAGPLPTQAPPPVAVARAPHVPQPSEQLPQLHFCIHSNPSWAITFLFAFQHYIVMLGSIVAISTILVPQMGGDYKDKAKVIQTLLLVSGLNTLLQTIIGTRLPTVMNPSFAFIVPVLSTIKDLQSQTFDNDHKRFIHTIRTVQGSMLVSSLVNIVIGYSRLWRNYALFFTPLSMAPVVCVVGLGLFGRGFPELAKCVEVGLPMLILLFLQQIRHTLLHRVVWSFAAVLTAAGAYNRDGEKTKQHCRVDRSYLLTSADCSVQDWIPYPFQWGAPTFSASHVFGMMGATLVSAVESTGTHYATARLSGATPPPRILVFRLQGVGMLIEGIFGALVGSSASVENTGLLSLTRVASRRSVQISTAFMIFFSIFGKFGAFFASIPLPIFAAIYCVLFALVAGVGISFVQFTNNNNLRNQYVVGISLFLFTTSAGHGPANTNAGWFNDILNSIFSSAPAVAMVVATVLDTTLLEGISADDRGLAWWTRFQKMGADARNDEFYSYPVPIRPFIPRRLF
ncbi:unnamed protein product [Spirodela intermedia]|uniref:Uncharacterized protein n=1 Tax=Spirodela intermedia TaxID=51605 RepID=A0A7I8I956_SPIIN|nr:unnamed protein product [Spirodela intermedia]CAA6653441.1 unnamed protein product [Spirodela intermedia]